LEVACVRVSRRDSESERPDLVSILVGARPSLHLGLAASCGNTVLQIHAEALIFKHNVIISREIPLLSRKIVITLLNFELYAICGVGTGVETEVGSRHLHPGATFVYDPTLRLGANAVIHLQRCFSCNKFTSKTQTFVLQVVEMNGLSLVGELACGTETNLVIGACNWAPIVGRRRHGRCRRVKAGRRLQKCLWTTAAIALNFLTKGIAIRLTAIDGLHSQASIRMVWVRNDVIIVVVEASVNGSISILTSTIRGSEEMEWVSRQNLGNVAICRDCGRTGVIDVQVDGRRAVVVNGVLTCH